MKALAFLTLISSTALQASEWVNFIRQTQVDSRVVWDMPVAPNGDSPSQLTIESGGALFQLWTIQQSEIQDYLLDQRLESSLPGLDLLLDPGQVAA